MYILKEHLGVIVNKITEEPNERIVKHIVTWENWSFEQWWWLTSEESLLRTTTGSFIFPTAMKAWSLLPVGVWQWPMETLSFIMSFINFWGIVGIGKDIKILTTKHLMPCGPTGYRKCYLPHGVTPQLTIKHMIIQYQRGMEYRNHH